MRSLSVEGRYRWACESSKVFQLKADLTIGGPSHSAWITSTAIIPTPSKCLRATQIGPPSISHEYKSPIKQANHTSVTELSLHALLIGIELRRKRLRSLGRRSLGVPRLDRKS